MIRLSYFLAFFVVFIGKIWYSLSYYGRVCNRQLSITKISTQLRRIIMKITEKTRRFIRSIALIVLPITLILSLSSVILKVYTQYTEDKLFKELLQRKYTMNIPLIDLYQIQIPRTQPLPFYQSILNCTMKIRIYMVGFKLIIQL